MASKQVGKAPSNVLDSVSKGYVDNLRYAPNDGTFRPVPIHSEGLIYTGETTSSQTTGFTFTNTYKVAVGATNLRVWIPAWWTQSYLTSSTNPRDNPLLQSLPIQASIRIADGIVHPLQFPKTGMRAPTIEPWESLTSDPIGVTVQKGDLVEVNVYWNASSTSSQKYPAGMASNTHLGFSPLFSDGYRVGNTVITNTGTQNSGASSASKYPHGILLGTPTGTTTPILALGDSILYGQGDTNNIHGYFLRAILNDKPVFRYAVQGILADDFANKLDRWGPMMPGFKHLYVALGTNDLAAVTPATRSLAQIKADLQKIAVQGRAGGLKVHVDTVPPRTTSTDSWATTANQTVLASESNRVALNDWIRANTTDFDFIHDRATALEVNAAGVPTLNGGRWPVVSGAATTTDGAHPLAAAADLLKNGVNLASFT